MRHLLAIWHRVIALCRRRRLERDLDDELAFHLAMRAADYRHQGIADADARYAACGSATSPLRRFGRRAWIR